jgi:mRNA-degrading endonuclease toxin of MazEF toxin-antitoxin module
MQNKYIRQNDIWMVNMGQDGIVGHEQRGTRPFYVISDTGYNQASKTPIGFFLSTSEHKKLNRYTVDVNMQGTIETVNTSQIRTISSERFMTYMGHGNSDDLNALMETFNKELLQNRK